MFEPIPGRKLGDNKDTAVTAAPTEEVGGTIGPRSNGDH